MKFVPEEFLGSNMIVATGETDQNGMASNVSIPTSGKQSDPPGVPQGFYRVEITKSGLNIPAKYNTQTVLGHVVAYGPQMIGTRSLRPTVLTRQVGRANFLLRPPIAGPIRKSALPEPTQYSLLMSTMWPSALLPRLS